MSSLLAEFLNKEGERLRAEQPARQSKIMEWQAAIVRLFAQLTEWVRAADPDGLIEIDDKQQQRLLETGLGLYYTRRLAIRFEAHQIWVIPEARNVIAFVPTPEGGERQADGLVIITDRAPVGDQVPPAEFNLYRAAHPDGDRWFIRYILGEKMEPLDREQFERVLVSLLQ
jgi:hypothetical protein